MEPLTPFGRDSVEIERPSLQIAFIAAKEFDVLLDQVAIRPGNGSAQRTLASSSVKSRRAPRSRTPGSRYRL